MGCISSKIVRRAVSFNEDYFNHSHSLRNKNMGPLLQDLIIFTPNPDTSTTDQLLANLVYTDKQEDEVEPQPPPVTCIVNTWELMQGLEEQELEQTVLHQLQESSMSATEVLEDSDDKDDDIFKKSRRSKSCQLFSEDMKVELNEELENMGSVFVRSRSTSFHTVEEYDALLQNNDHQSTLFVSSSMSEYLNHDDDTQETTSTSSNSNFKAEKRVPEKGLRRRAIAKGLELLEIPPTTISCIEFPTPAGLRSFRKWADIEGRPDSPGDSSSSSYVTPKFGSYNVSSSSSRLKEEGMLNPELVAAFEECMQQLQLEEDNLLQQMNEANDRMQIEA